MRKNILIFIPAADFNEEEFLTVKNSFLKDGCSLFIASDSTGLCKGSNGMKVKADVNLFNVHPGNFDAFVLIGGNGMRTYWNNQILKSIAQKFYELRKIIGAICSAPILLGNAGILKDHKATCYPQDRTELERTGKEFSEQPVVSCGNIVTAQAPKDSLEFSRTLIHAIH